MAAPLFTYCQTDLVNKFGIEFVSMKSQVSVPTIPKSKALSERSKGSNKELEVDPNIFFCYCVTHRVKKKIKFCLKSPKPNRKLVFLHLKIQFQLYIIFYSRNFPGKFQIVNHPIFFKTQNSPGQKTRTPRIASI